MDIPSQYNPKEVEDKHYKKWFSSGYFNAKVMPGRKPFCIVIPPPNVTGILHMGHALNNTIQDVLVRYKRMQGFESLWMPGTDHAGIATQNMVEKSLAKEGLRKEDLGREEFTRRLWDWTDKHGTTILNQLKKLGASCDWDRTRFTMDSAYQDAVAEVFIRLAQKGLIYRGTRLINWCPRCKTALSDEESPHREIDGYLYYLKYPVKARGQKQDIPGHVVVATTRPETMLGDTAVAVHPKDERYRWLKDAIVTLPLVNRELKVVEDEAIDPAFGTGVVKVTPAHDPVDFALGKKYGLEFINIFNHDATLNENVPKDFARMERHDARKKVLEELAKIGLYDDKEKKPYKVNAGHCYRCHTLIEPWLSPQWFVNMKPLAAPAIRAVENDDVRFTPVRWKKVYLNWMNNIQDWCISRQIWWGHPIPAWYCLKCNCDAGKIIKTVLPGNSPQAKYVIADGAKYVISKERPEKCPDCGAGEFIKDPDVLDTWFSSWLWPFATFYWPFNHAGQGLAAAGQGKNLTSSEKILKREREVFKKELEYFYPTSTLVTASEILFFWVARMIMAGFDAGRVRNSGDKRVRQMRLAFDPLHDPALHYRLHRPFQCRIRGADHEPRPGVLACRVRAGRGHVLPGLSHLPDSHRAAAGAAGRKAGDLLRHAGVGPGLGLQRLHAGCARFLRAALFFGRGRRRLHSQHDLLPDPVVSVVLSRPLHRHLLHRHSHGRDH